MSFRFISHLWNFDQISHVYMYNYRSSYKNSSKPIQALFNTIWPNWNDMHLSILAIQNTILDCYKRVKSNTSRIYRYRCFEEGGRYANEYMKHPIYERSLWYMYFQIIYLCLGHMTQIVRAPDLPPHRLHTTPQRFYGQGRSLEISSGWGGGKDFRRLYKISLTAIFPRNFRPWWYNCHMPVCL